MDDNKTHKPGRHPKSLANLKPATKGEIRNPNGARSHDHALRALRKITNETVKEIIEIGLTGTLEELQAIIKDPEAPALKRGLAKAIGDAVVQGDVIILERLFERLTGRVPIAVDHTSKGESLATPALTQDQIKRMAKEILEE